MAKRKNKEIDPNVCWKCGSKNLIVSNSGDLIHCKSCGHGIEIKESVKEPGKKTIRRY